MDVKKKHGFVLDDQYLLHDTGSRHPESPRRLKAIDQGLASHGTAQRWQRIEPRPARLEELSLIHRPGHVERIEKAARRAPAHLDPDTVVSAESYRIGLLAAGGVLKCVEEICSGNLRQAFAFVRPPGHHAEPDKAMGFCLFNNVAVAAAYARHAYHLSRVAIVDIDLHHGNGTQACYYREPHVLYISSHQYPYYPGTGDFDEIGADDGKGYTINFPLPAGTGDETLVPLYSRVVKPILQQYRPQLILVSAGFDAYFQDPLGGLAATAKGYASVAASLIKAAEECCDGKICFVLEGGYSMQGLQECTQSVLAEMEADTARELSVAETPLWQQISNQAKKHVGDVWKW